MPAKVGIGVMVCEQKLQNQHGVAVGAEAVAFFDGYFVGVHHMVVSTECSR